MIFVKQIIYIQIKQLFFTFVFILINPNEGKSSYNLIPWNVNELLQKKQLFDSGGNF